MICNLCVLNEDTLLSPKIAYKCCFYQGQFWRYDFSIVALGSFLCISGLFIFFNSDHRALAYTKATACTVIGTRLLFPIGLGEVSVSFISQPTGIYKLRMFYRFWLPCPFPFRLFAMLLLARLQSDFQCVSRAR